MTRSLSVRALAVAVLLASICGVKARADEMPLLSRFLYEGLEDNYFHYANVVSFSENKLKAAGMVLPSGRLLLMDSNQTYVFKYEESNITSYSRHSRFYFPLGSKKVAGSYRVEGDTLILEGLATGKIATSKTETVMKPPPVIFLTFQVDILTKGLKGQTLEAFGVVSRGDPNIDRD